MIERYSLPEMEKIWTEENRFNKMLEVEIAVCEALSKKGEIPETAFKRIKQKAGFEVERIREIEKVVKHDVIAFLTSISEKVGKDSVYIHRGLTSSDVLDTALSLQLKEASQIILSDLEILSNSLKQLAAKYRNTIMIGRTHGIHAEPITFGFKVAGWYSEILRNIDRFKTAIENISYGKISGVVGTFAHSDMEIEKYVMNKLKLIPEPVSTQIIPRDRHAYYLTTLAIIASSVERFATEIRSGQRTEISEIAEPFTPGQKGSSAMPHKRNPVTCEQLCGLARIMRTNALASIENVALWNERDISHSSVERIILPDSTILLDYILKKINYVISNLSVYPEKMNKNLMLTSNAIFSQRLLLAIVKKGAKREEVYPVIQKLSQEAEDKKVNLKELIISDDYIKKYLSGKEIEENFNIQYYVRNIKKILKKVGI